ncbi:Autoinducer-2 Exporter [Helicobacter sp. NHP19-003]|uniref:Autoinducer-2 Exporter n=1 Tax=Helicobacter gastrocanis TaxID=2849641 RepID=A0ABN6I3M4_9HELI|nr:AI-2E family transporter [Helicobacter sp. NHP19-003]BCZ18196.1 Autoinducer-2 Exporter [Helicobacter sp. NHP19-003]
MRPVYFFWLLFAVAFYWMLYLYEDFLMDLLIAGLLCVTIFWLKEFFDRYMNNLCSSLLCVVVLLSFLVVPLYFLIYKSTDFIVHLNLAKFAFYFNKSKSDLLLYLERFPTLSAYAHKILSNFSAQNLTSYALHLSSDIGKFSLKFASDTAMVLVFLFLCFFYGERFYDYILDILPFEKIQSRGIFREVAGILRVVLLTSIINVVLQGMAFGALVAGFGLDWLSLGILYGLSSLIPIVGGALVWVPVSVYELYRQHSTIALIIALYSVILIGGLIDSLIKPWLIGVIKKQVLKISLKINEILIFFSILAGISKFGFWGIAVGPTITAFFIVLLRLYEKVFTSKPQQATLPK